MPDIPFNPAPNHGPQLRRDALLRAYVEGADQGAGEGLWLSNDLLLADPGVVLALRIPTDLGREPALLVRSDLPEALSSERAALEEALTAAGCVLVEHDAVLAGVVGIEMAGLRGTAWDLWAADPDVARDALARRALGEFADLIDTEQVQRQVQRRTAIDQTLAELEREFDEGGRPPER